MPVLSDLIAPSAPSCSRSGFGHAVATGFIAAFIAALGGLAIGACASSPPLKVDLGGGVVPLVNGADPGAAVGQCVRFFRNGPSSFPCPAGVSAFFGSPSEHAMDKPGGYGHGVFVHDRLGHYAYEVVVAYELLTYTSRSVSWKKKMSAKDLPAARALCADERNHSELVIVRSFEGCGVTLSGLQDAAQTWTMKTLGTHGSSVGQPQGFWAQDPSLERPPDKAKCKTKRVVQAEVVPVGTLCQRYAAHLSPPITQTPTQAADAKPAAEPKAKKKRRRRKKRVVSK